jgi:MarR family transcriptional regulator, 2-MHQ and catechol-resistance regulon repressor
MKIEDAIKTSFESTRQKAYINLIFTANEVTASAKKRFKEVNITFQQYNVLRILRGKFPESLNPGEIKSVMLDKSPDLTRLVDRLLTKELVERGTCEINRRKIDIKISQKGLNFLSSIDQKVQSVHQAHTLNLTETEAESLSNLLDKIRG